MNGGAITNLPAECVVEVPGFVDKNGINIPVVGDLPLGCAEICSQSVAVQRLSVEAAVAGDETLLLQALMLDPLVGAVCSPPEIAQMRDDMLIAEGSWLPQYKQAILGAQARRKLGPRLPTMETYRGSTRQAVKSVEELSRKAEETRKRAGDTNKAQH
jgi:alpha-galactosidase